MVQDHNINFVAYSKYYTTGIVGMRDYRVLKPVKCTFFVYSVSFSADKIVQ